MHDEELRATDDAESKKTVETDVDADNQQASGLLGVIGRGNTQKSDQEEQPPPAMRTSHGVGPFLLESLYFRSFGERELLTREEEVAVAKQVDQGTRRIRVTLRHVVNLLARSKRTAALSESVKKLQLVKRLSGLSATALDDTEQTILALLKPPMRTMKPALTTGQRLQELLDEIRSGESSSNKAKTNSCGEICDWWLMSPNTIPAEGSPCSTSSKKATSA